MGFLEKRCTGDDERSLVPMISYGFGKFIAEFLTGAYGIMVFFFFEKELGLSSGFVAAATIIYSAWNAINDPLVGYLTSKRAPFSGKLGKRFAWIALGLLLCVMAFGLIFAVPKAWTGQANKVAVFCWMVAAVCLYDTAYSCWEVNYQGIFPDKFRKERVRVKTSQIGTSIGVFGIAAGSIVPPLFYEYGNPASYLKAGICLAAIAIAAAALMVPGIYESKAMRTRYEIEKKREEKGFIESARTVLKYRDLLAILLMLFFYQSACICMTGSVNYVVDGVLQMKSSATTPIFAAMLAGTLSSIPIWGLFQKKAKNNQRILIISCLVMAAFAFPMTFMNTQLGFCIFIFLWGFGLGGYWTFMTPAMAEVIDEIVVGEKRRDDGVVMGFRAFFMRLSYASQAIVFWLCHTLTGYKAGVVTIENGKKISETIVQTDLAKLGINLHIGLIPALFFLLAALVMWRMNTLTPQKAQENRAKLKEMNI